MSRWLSQVANYLDQLDDQAEDFVEENINAPDADNSQKDESSNIDSILAQRGLAASVFGEDGDLDLDLDDPFGSSADDVATPHETQSVIVDICPEEESKDEPKPETTGQHSLEDGDEEKNDSAAPIVETAAEESSEKADGSMKLEKTPSTLEDTMATEPPTDESKPISNAKPTTTMAKDTVQAKKTAPPPPPMAAPNSAPAPKLVAPPVVKDPNPALVKQAKEAQQEVRTLRKHMLTLNKQLESVESEVAAQRKELEMAAAQMDKDRAKAKEERDKERKRHAEELKALQANHEAALRDQKTRLEKQLADMTQRLQDIEQTRMQEGGNWDKELQGAVEREQIVLQKNIALEDERATLLAQIGTLQSQQEALGDRIESLSHTADSAMEREREAEERLDQALSVHAHQISQRQARESELERTIAELGAAMAALRQKEINRFADFSNKGSEVTDTAGENTSQDSGLRVRLDIALHDLEAAQTNLDLERQRTEALQRELREVNGERTEEAANIRMRQNKYDRQIAELTLQLTRAQQQSGVDVGKDGGERKDSMGDDKEIFGLKTQIKELSEEVLKAREKIGSYSSELAALKSRLKGAVDRAEKAELALEENLSIVPSGDSFDRMERGAPTSGTATRRRAGKAPTSISAAMRLNSTERVGKAVDVLDSFSVSTGKYLRVNPWARAAFIMYLSMLHLWTFVVIFFHAHNFEDIHRDGAELPHGPDAMMQKQLGAGGQVVAAAVSAAKAAAKAVADKQTRP